MKRILALTLCLFFLILSGCQWNAKKLAIIQITPRDVALNPGSSQIFTAIGRNRNGEEVSIQPQWVLSEAIGTLSSTTGTNVTFTATTKGSSFLKVVAEGVTGSAFISVTELILTRLTINPNHLRIGVNQTFQFELTGEDQFGQPMQVQKPDYEITGEIGTFHPDLLVFAATSPGTGTLTLQVEDVTITAEITVEEPLMIPDPALEEALRAALDNNDDPLFPYQLASIETLVAEGKGISNLTGLENCTGLKTLILSQNQITDLTPLTDLTQLTGLYLKNNQITDLTPIVYFNQLKRLSLAHNPLVNAEPLGNLLNLEWLDLTNAGLTHVDMLALMDEMQALYLSYNHDLTDISALENMFLLQTVHLSGTFVSDLTPLENKQHLQELLANGTSIGSSASQLAPLSGCISLKIFQADESGITTIAPLAGLTTLQELRLQKNVISDISALAGLEQIQKLWLSDNLIDTIDPLVENTGLAEGDLLHLEGNLLNLNEGSDDRAQIAILEARGVEVYYLTEENSLPADAENNPTESKAEMKQSPLDKHSKKITHPRIMQVAPDGRSSY